MEQKQILDSGFKQICHEWRTKIVGFVVISVIGYAYSSLMIMLGILIILCVILLKSYFLSSDNIPTLYYKESPLNEYLMKNCDVLRQPYQPTFWAMNPHLQTFLASLSWLLQHQPIKFEREYLQMNDKGIVAFDWCIKTRSPVKRQSPVLIVFPGMCSDAQTAIHVCNSAKDKGFRTVVINNRGHGNSFLSTSKINSYGDPQDLRQCILYIKQKFPKSAITAIAIGSGSTVLFSYLGEYGSSCGIKTASFISPIYDISKETISTIPKLYHILLLFGMKKILLKHSIALSKIVDMKAALISWDLLDYQYEVYCKLYGISSIEQFLERNDPMRDVDDLAIPVLCINSADDPVYKKKNIPYDIFNFYPNMLLLETSFGGHCGFWANTIPRSWATDVALDYITSVLKFTGEINEWIATNQ